MPDGWEGVAFKMYADQGYYPYRHHDKRDGKAYTSLKKKEHEKGLGLFDQKKWDWLIANFTWKPQKETPRGFDPTRVHPRVPNS